MLNLSSTLLHDAERARNPKRGAVKAQMAVCIETLWLTALRRLNLVRLDIERNLIRSGAGEKLHIAVEREAVKNRVALEFPIPLESSELFERYIRVFRPRLASPTNTALFPGINGGPKNACFLGTQISRTILKYTGLRWHPHLFRHAVALLFLRDNPGQYETVRRFLGHRSIETTIRFYCDTETETAVDHFHRTILRRRKQPPPKPPQSHKPKGKPRRKK
jgi:integrase